MPDISSLDVGLVNASTDLRSQIVSLLASEPCFHCFHIDLDALAIPIPETNQNLDLIILGEDESKDVTCRLVRFVKKVFHPTSILIVLYHHETFPLSELFRHGANGCLCIEAVKNDLLLAMAAVSDGRLYVDVCQAEHTQNVKKIVVEDNKLTHTEGQYEALSDMERRVLVSVARGYTNQQIADRLILSKKSVEKYRSRIKAKLGLEKRTSFVQYALDHKMLARK